MYGNVHARPKIRSFEEISGVMRGNGGSDDTAGLWRSSRGVASVPLPSNCLKVLALGVLERGKNADPSHDGCGYAVTPGEIEVQEFRFGEGLAERTPEHLFGTV